MNGLNALRKLFGLHPMNEAPAAEAPAPAAAPATEAPATDTPTATPESSSLLSGEPAADKPAEAPAVEGEAKPEGEKPAKEEGAKEDDAKEPEGAPEAYTEFTLPEGLELDSELLPDVHELFKELNLPQDKAQEVLGKLLQIQDKQLGTPEQQLARAEEQIVQLNQSLAEQCRNLPEIGGEKFADSLATASKVMQEFGTPELRSLIALTGVGSHPEFFKMMVAIGAKMQPDTFEQGGEQAPATQSAGKIMFGDLKL